MSIQYDSVKMFCEDELKDLFLSVDWSSGNYPDKLVAAMKNYPTVFTAWDENKLIGLISCMDDGVMTAYVHYLLVHREYQGQGVGKELVNMVKKHYKGYLRIVLVAYDDKISFYESCGFNVGESQSPMFITTLTT